jgi:hypothetical protein
VLFRIYAHCAHADYTTFFSVKSHQTPTLCHLIWQCSIHNSTFASRIASVEESTPWSSLIYGWSHFLSYLVADFVVCKLGVAGALCTVRDFANCTEFFLLMNNDEYVGCTWLLIIIQLHVSLHS